MGNVGYIPLETTPFWLIMGICGFLLILGYIIRGRGKVWKWVSLGSSATLVAFAMFGLVIPALVPMETPPGNDVGTPLFQFSIALSADCNDLTGLDAVQDCALAAELNINSDEKVVDVLHTVDQELVSVLTPDELALDFAIERYCEGDPDPIHCPIEDGVYIPAAVNVELVTAPTMTNLTTGSDHDIIQTLGTGVDIVAWSDQTNVVLGVYKSSPLQLEPGEFGTITFSVEWDEVYFSNGAIDDEMGVGSMVLKIAGQTVTINHIIIGFTA